KLMINRSIEQIYHKEHFTPGATIVETRNLSGKGFENVSLTVRAGEIVGIAGVAGNGQSELLEAISGIRHAVSGSVMLDGKPIDLTGEADPGELRDRGLAHVPEDRH
ncbi:ATP-binding cassette domain-containing protein, partial [Mesorhizobium sp. M5C.F.Ca.ET.164.01.1.1]|uniref:ATP-binding cassette domain-containing protein n=1 Tax=Mesorhizobium sp. M5C.F.Ca.ET.164.01.1.1 TaxID=2563957 RepID=UPI001FEF9C6A